MNKHLIKLATFLLDIKAGFRKTKAKTGFISNNIQVVKANADAIKELASALDFTLLELLPKYNKDTNPMSQHCYILGKFNSNECQTLEDFNLDA